MAVFQQKEQPSVRGGRTDRPPFWSPNVLQDTAIGWTVGPFPVWWPVARVFSVSVGYHITWRPRT